MKFLLKVVLWAMLLLFAFNVAAPRAEAATRTVCAHLAFNDDRVSCPAPGTSGARFTCQPANGWSTAMGATVQLWDKDLSGGDDFIGYFVTGRAQGYGTCFTFEWEGSEAYDAEANPDVYIRYTYEASGQTNGNFAQVRDLNNVVFPALTWRNGTASNPDQFVSVECQSGVNCWINGGNILWPNTSGSSSETIGMAVADAAGFAMVPWVSVEDQTPSRLIRLLVGSEPDACSTGCANSQTELEFTWAKANQPEVVMHEMGHLYHFRAFDGEMASHNYSMPPGDGSWGQWSLEYEKVTFLEGWATYFAAVGYYDPNSLTVTPILGSSNIESNQYGGSFGTCATGRNRVGNVIRGLWDMDDALNEASHSSNPNTEPDYVSWASVDLLRTLEDYQSGTSNRRRAESDNDGVNMRDFVAVGAFTTNTSKTLLEHNCLEGQDAN